MKQSTYLKVIFFGSSNYCIPILDSLNKNYHLIAILTKPNSKVQEFAKTHHIKFFTPQDKNELFGLKDKVIQRKPDLAIVADYGLIIPSDIFNLPKYKTLNIHFSKLPDLRGPSPVQYTILRGDNSAWISIIIMSEVMDTGDYIWQKEIRTFDNQQLTINNETSDSLYKKLFNIVAVELPNVISKYVQKELRPIKQDHSKATYTKILTRDDGFIPPHILSVILSPDFKSERSIPLEAPKTKGILRFVQDDNWSMFIDRAIRAFTPWPELWTEVYLTKGLKTPGMWPKDSFQVEESEKTEKKRLKILKAHTEQTTNNKQRITKLVISVVQLEGKKPVSWKQFKEGYPNFSFLN